MCQSLAVLSLYSNNIPTSVGISLQPLHKYHSIIAIRHMYAMTAAPRPAIQLSKSVHTLTEQLTYLKCAHAYTEYSCQSGYKAQNITHAKQRVAPSLCELSLITQAVGIFQHSRILLEYSDKTASDWHINYPVHPPNNGLCARPRSGDSIAKSAYNKNLLY